VTTALERRGKERGKKERKVRETVHEKGERRRWRREVRAEKGEIGSERERVCLCVGERQGER
jgi:hypothetical protein